VLSRRLVRLSSYLPDPQRLTARRRLVRLAPSSCAFSNNQDAPSATPALARHFPAHSNTRGSPAWPATAGPTPPSGPGDNPLSRSTAGDADSARPAQRVSCNTHTCAGHTVSLPAIFGLITALRQTHLSRSEERSRREVNPPARSRFLYLESGRKSTAPLVTFIPPEEDSFHPAAHMYDASSSYMTAGKPSELSLDNGSRLSLFSGPTTAMDPRSG